MLSLLQLVSIPQGGVASAVAIGNQTSQYVRLKDDDKANIALSNSVGIPDLASLSGTTNAEKAVIKLNDGVS